MCVCGGGESLSGGFQMTVGHPSGGIQAEHTDAKQKNGK